MNLFANSTTEEKYLQLGFVPADLSLMLVIGKVSIYAVGHPYKGVVLIFESITPRRMCQYEVCLPKRCSIEQIAGLIYVNILQNFRDSAATCKTYFHTLGIPLFQ